MTSNQPITFEPVTPCVGALVGGIDLTGSLDDATIADLHAALMRHHVLFFRDQDITPLQQSDFAARFGRLRKARRAAFGLMEGAPAVHVLENDRERPPNVNHYHSDGIFRREPEFASILRAVTVPQAGGDTIFVSLYAAYDALSEGMKAYLEDLQAVNSFMKLHGSPKKARSWEGDNFERMQSMNRDHPPVAHPLVRRHPVTGRKHLYLSESFTTHIVDVDEEESQRVLDFLFRHVAKPEFQCRFQWRNNSVAFWDNRAALHYAVADYWPETRIMNRVSIETDEIGTTAAAA